MPIHSRRRGITPIHGSLYDAVASGGGGFTAAGVHFDGSTSYGINGGDFTGQADSKVGTLSFWMKPGLAGGGGQTLFGQQNSGFSITGLFVNVGNGMRVRCFNSASAAIVDLQTSSGSGSGGATPPDDGAHNWVLGAPWRWVGVYWDNAAGVAQIYTSAFTSTGAIDAWDGNGTPSNTDIDWTNPGGYPSIGSHSFLGSPYTGDMAEFYLNTATAVDLSNTTNLRKFISSTGHPVDLGATGSTPTGTAPLIYFKGGAASWGTNQAGHGNFTVQSGTLTNSSTNP